MLGGKRVFLLWMANQLGGKECLLLWVAKKVFIIVGGKRVFIIVGGKRVLALGGKRVFDTGGKRVLGPGRQKSLFNLGWQRSVWQKVAKITFCQMWQKFGRKRSCSRSRPFLWPVAQKLAEL